MVDSKIKRRKHKNSKYGCPNCKTRRVKCSEDLPQCQNCIKHKVKCGYLDYDDDQLEELRAYKVSKKDEVSELSDRSKRSNSIKKEERFDSSTRNNSETTNSSSGIRENSTSSIPTSLDNTTTFSKQNDLDIENLTIGFKSAPSINYSQNYSNALNHAQSSISQNFDNLLPKASDMSIVYPVYSITNNQELSPYVQDTEYIDYDQLENYYQGSGSSNDMEQQCLLQSLNNPKFQHPYYSSSVPIQPVRPLPHAVPSTGKFKKLKRNEKNYRHLLIDMVIKLGPLINTGQATLIQIRELYGLWLNSFLYQSRYSDLMFSCLINLTTNFLISNSFNNFNLINSDPNKFLEITNVKNILILVSVKYYSVVIKGLRNFLNNNFTPELCSSMSYILSLMSIYDPEATCNSTRCFSDGLFSVLKYNIDLSIKRGQTPPILIPVHLRLMHNIEKSIYFPGYDPTFLNEYRQKLTQLGKIIKQVNLSHDQQLSQTIQKDFDNLSDYTDKTLNEYLPILMANLEDNSVQEEFLFRMTSKWVRLFPSRLLVITKKAHIIEQVLYLFYKFFKKALFAILPQVKFYFLRDFDSPLMLDVFCFINDNEIFTSEKFDDAQIEPFKTELLKLSAYSIRGINYFQKRIQFLYKTIVYQGSTKDLFPLEQRKGFIINIPKLRNIFYESLNLKETNIKSFGKTFIKPFHFPHLEDYNEGNDIDVDVNFLKLTPIGFLENDVLGD